MFGTSLVFLVISLILILVSYASISLDNSVDVLVSLFTESFKFDYIDSLTSTLDGLFYLALIGTGVFFFILLLIASIIKKRFISILHSILYLAIIYLAIPIYLYNPNILTVFQSSLDSSSILILVSVGLYLIGYLFALISTICAIFIKSKKKKKKKKDEDDEDDYDNVKDDKFGITFTLTNNENEMNKKEKVGDVKNVLEVFLSLKEKDELISKGEMFKLVDEIYLTIGKNQESETSNKKEEPKKDEFSLNSNDLDKKEDVTKKEDKK